ncbi:MAG: hypothetical protein ACLSE6_03010 [Alphaproteobacteria bacterium]
MMTEQMSVKIAALPSLRLTVEAHGLMAKKALGQNFLDQNITDKILISLQNKTKGFFQHNVLKSVPVPRADRAVLLLNRKA